MAQIFVWWDIAKANHMDRGSIGSGKCSLLLILTCIHVYYYIIHVYCTTRIIIVLYVCGVNIREFFKEKKKKKRS